jgi:thiamine biosynthesis protein ThiI
LFRSCHFKVKCSRIELGAAIRDHVGAAVSLRDPTVTVFVEVLINRFVSFTEHLEGALGLPVWMSRSVAAWMMMQRGCGVVYVHFYSAPCGE